MSDDKAKQNDEEFFKERGFGLKIGFGERPALIVIDMLKAFTDPDMMLGANLDNENRGHQAASRHRHERDIPVIFSTVMREGPARGSAPRGAAARP